MVGGYLAERFGGKWIMGLALLGCGVLELSIPWVALFTVEGQVKLAGFGEIALT